MLFEEYDPLDGSPHIKIDTRIGLKQLGNMVLRYREFKRVLNKVMAALEHVAKNQYAIEEFQDLMCIQGFVQLNFYARENIDVLIRALEKDLAFMERIYYTGLQEYNEKLNGDHLESVIDIDSGKN